MEIPTSSLHRSGEPESSLLCHLTTLKQTVMALWTQTGHERVPGLQIGRVIIFDAHFPGPNLLVKLKA